MANPVPETLVDRYVTPDQRYRRLLGTVLNLRGEDRVSFGRALAEDARAISDDDLDNLLGHDWRSQFTAAWLIAIARRTRYRDRIGELLLASRLTYAGKGFCLALLRFGTPEDARLLAGYLERYLPQLELSYDQSWAMATLLHLDTRLGTQHAEQFLGPGGAWQRWAQARPSRPADPHTERPIIADLSSFAEECARLATG